MTKPVKGGDPKLDYVPEFIKKDSREKYGDTLEALPQKDFSNHQAEKSKQFLSLFEFSFRPTVHPVSPPRLRKTVCHRPGPGRDVRM